MSVCGARTEVKRCASAIAKGGDPKFWFRRLSARINYLHSEIAILEGAQAVAAAAMKARKP